MRKKSGPTIVVILAILLALGNLPVTAAPSTLGSRTLREGVRGEDVRELQAALAALGYQPLAVDGRFGPQTKAKVIEFQKRNNVPATGVFAKLSLAALNSASAARAKADATARKAAAATAEKAAVLQDGFYRVRKGDTLNSVAARLGVEMNILCRYNNILDPNMIYAGQLLMLSPPSIEAAEGENKEASEVSAPKLKRDEKEETAELQNERENKSEVGPAAEATKAIAFTFNDGPHPEYTDAIAAALAQYGGKGTFFAVGKEAEAYPEIMERLVQGGNEIGNHTYSHISLSGKREAEIEAEIRKADLVIQAFTGMTSRYFRSPGGEMSENISKALSQTGHNFVLWSNLGARDKLNPGVGFITSNVLQTAYDGAIIMLHDTNAQTAEALPEILAKLSREGFRFVTLTELLTK